MKSILFYDSCKVWLNDFFNEKKKAEAKFTIRKLAAELNISKTALNDVLLGKRKFSKKTAITISESLNLSEKERNHFLILNKNTKPKECIDNNMLSLSEKDFKLMSEWYFIGIICYAQMKDNFADAKYLSKKFGIDESMAQAALDTLLKLKLIEIKDGKFYRTTNPIEISPNVPSENIRNYHKQNLKIAETTIDNLHMNERLFTSISIPSNKNKLKDVSKIVNQMKNKIAYVMGTEEPNDVYTISIQIFPITKK